MKEVFPGPQDAKITIEVGDYRVTMSGKMNPPNIKSYSQRDDIWSLEPDVYKNVELNIVPRSVIKIERIKWTIPLAIRPRIEK